MEFLAGLDYIEGDVPTENGLGKPQLSPKEIYEYITDKMITAVKNAKDDFKEVWDENYRSEAGYLIPRNFKGGNSYRGVNTLLLKGGNLFHIFDNPYFLTEKQIEDLKGSLKKDAKGVMVVYFTSLYKFNGKAKDEPFTSYRKEEMLAHLKSIGYTAQHFDILVKTIPILKQHLVFNGSDINGIDFKLGKLTNEQKTRLGYVAPSDPKNKDAKNPIAELIIKNFPKGSAKIVHGHKGASYNITKDMVKMPDFKAFVSSEDYYSTLFHEMIHSTAHSSRLNRTFGKQFGDLDYAKEELIAEFGAVFLSAQAGILWKTQKTHAAYLKNWQLAIQLMGEDSKLLMRSATEAQKAVDYLLQVNEDKEPKFYEGFKKATKADFSVEVEKAKTNKKSLVPVSLSRPQVQKIIKVPGETVEKNSAAFLKKQRKHKVVKRYEIADKDLAIFLGNLEIKPKESLVATIAGKQGSGKTRFAFRFIDALAKRYKVAHITMEEHKDSDLYWEKADMYFKGANTLQNTNIFSMENISELDTIIKAHDVIVIDSFAKLKELDSKLELDTHLRKKYDGKLFLIVFQQTADGKMRGGSKSAFDGDCIFYVEKSPDFKKHYVYTDKNRYQNRNLEELQYNIHSGRLNPIATEKHPNLEEVEF